MVRVFGLSVCAVVSMVCFVGCSPITPGVIDNVLVQNKPTILSIVKNAAKSGSYQGLKAWEKKKPGAAKEASLALNKNINEVLLPYFNGGSLQTSASVNDFMNSSLFKDLPPEVSLAVHASAAVLDIYLQVPSTTTYLTADQKDYIVAFLTGLADGTAEFNKKGVVKEWKNPNPEAKRYWLK